MLLLIVVTPAQVSIQNARFDVLSSVAAGSATLTSTPLDLGTIQKIFDGDTNSLARTPNISPAFVQIAYTTQRTVRKFRVFLSYGTSYQWSVEKADTQADMTSQTGTWARITPITSMPQGTWSEYALPQPITAKLFRLTVKRFGGDNYCHMNEWEIYGDVVVNQLSIAPTNSVIMYAGDTRQFSALGKNTAVNESYNVDPNVTWKVAGGIGTVSSTGLFTATKAGTGSVSATLTTLNSPAVNITVLEPNLKPDIDVLYIERTPRLSFNPSDTTYSTGLPTARQAMSYLAHVKNWGTNAVQLPFEWWFDDQLASNGVVGIEAGAELKLAFPWNWETKNHTLEFRADPANTLKEATKLNNRRKIRTNALLAGLWVEQGLYNYFHNTQLKLNDGANSFEDWGQRMVDRWNLLFSKAIFPWAPEGFLDRMSLDKVVLVPDGALPLAGGIAGNNPDSRDRTVDVEWGYPWNPKSVEQGEFYMFRWNGPFFIDYGSIHEMNHARYHVDLYALDENHPGGAAGGNVQLIDDNGNPVPGSSLMPFIAWDVVYYNKWRDIMGAGSPIFDGYSAGAWNWKDHKRGQGNQNSPPDIGRFLNDLPASNTFQFIDQNGVPLAGADVSYYRATGGFYTKIFDNTPEGTYVADARGEVVLPRNPFGGDQPLGGFGPASPDIIFMVRYNGQQYYFFQEVTDFNIAYWSGNKSSAHYIREIDLRDKGVTIPAGGFLGNYFNGPIHGALAASRTDTKINFSWSGSPAPGVNAENFSVYWEGRIQFPDGWKQFTVTSDGPFQLWIDGRLVFDKGTNATLQTWTPIIFTASSSPFINPGQSTQNGNNHRVEVRYSHASGAAQVALSWGDEPAPGDGPANAWRADYYNTKTLNGYILSRLEEAIDNDYAGGSPDPMVFSDAFSARWTGDWDFGAGTYNFTAITDDGMRVWIDDVQMLNKWFDQPPTTYKFSKVFAAPGRHRVRIEYYEGAATARAFFSWSGPPAITVQPQSQNLATGDTLTLSVQAAAPTELSYQWYLNKVAIPGAVNPTLTITNIQPGQAGDYFVIVTAGTSSASSSRASVTVASAQSPKFERASLDSSGVFHATISGSVGAVFELQGSPDLKSWTRVAEVTNTSGTVEATDSQAPQSPYKFYRVLVK